nr:hypothetical protein [Tanacetum cinerariifolium]
ISSDVAELKDMVKALLLDKKNQSPAPTPSFTPAPVKAVEPNREIPPPEVSMADNRTMAELLQAPTEGYEDGPVLGGKKVITGNEGGWGAKKLVNDSQKFAVGMIIPMFNK